MPLVLVTGNSGVGKSAVQQRLVERGVTAIEADWEGYSGWVDRTTGQPVTDPPYPVPPGWLGRFAWRMSRSRVGELKASVGSDTVFLCGSAENEAEVRDLFDAVVCLVVDDETLRRRLRARTTNAFGRHPEELAAALSENGRSESAYRLLGATIVDATRPVAEVADALLAAAENIDSESDDG